MIVAYDYVRGEPRGKIRKNQVRTEGSCIDCNLCVESCSTGIDIRNGSQLECLNCFSCVDACNGVMDKIGQKRGLIRFASEASIANSEKFKFTPRIFGYSIVLFILLTTVSILLASRSDVETTLLRTRGQMYQTLPDNKTSNLYTMQIVNKTFNNIPIELKLKEPQGEIKFVGKEFNILGKEEMTEGEFFVILPNSEITKIKTPVVIDVVSGGKVINEVKSSFLGSNM
jgi:cytochrome c oxidase accessory protein FixG